MYNEDQWRPVAVSARYRCLDEERPEIELIQSVFAEMIVFRRISGASLPIEGALTLSIAARNALMSVADTHGTMTDLLTGHGRHPHCAYVPLPFAGSDHADGRLMGIAVVVPRGVEREERRKVLATCGWLEIIHLPKGLGVWKVEAAGEERATTLHATWAGPSLEWATATPILLDQFPKQKANRPGVEQIIAASCERVGLPAPESIEHGPYSWLEGVSPVPQFRLLRDQNDRPRWGVHAKVRFPHPVRGPVLLGAGRYFGLGLLRPLRSDNHDTA